MRDAHYHIQLIRTTVRRLITTHDSAGVSTFLQDSTAPTTLLNPDDGATSPVLSHVWTTASVPVDNEDTTDWAQAAADGNRVRAGRGWMDFPGVGWYVYGIRVGMDGDHLCVIL